MFARSSRRRQTKKDTLRQYLLIALVDTSKVNLFFFFFLFKKENEREE
jgi:hypothetical protein